MPPLDVTSDLRRLGQQTNGRGDRVALVHGFSQTKTSWSHVVSRLSAGYEVIAVDLPDHGASGSIHASSLEDAASILGQSVGEATYVGYSLGGRVSLVAALDVPHVVRRLVLVSVTAGIADQAQRLQRRHADDTLADRLDPPDSTAGLSLEAFLDEWLAQPLFRDLDERAQDRSARRLNTTRGLANSLRYLGQGTQQPLWHRLGELSMPVLVLAGEEDEKFRTLGAELARSIGSNATFSVLTGAGHAAPFEQTEAFCDCVEQFMSDS